ncbi:uncharacterized protein LOC112887940 [Panicum hallii]|uniref:uncharacterized protein LOC112887940 n=1 Tax=Panicum hallii TaxID=206008 RepID=UPI000DF4D0D5|nr:uncharacterized protein LOC112887940 [Panicum hallii]
MAGIGMGGSDGDDRKKANKVIADIDEDELFELDITLLDGRHRGHSAAVADEDDDAAGQHALLANCLLPARSVSNAVPVDASSSALSSSYPYSGYYSSRRLIVFAGGGGIGRRLFLGRPGNSARFCFSSRGFETYFQRSQITDAAECK